MRQYTPFAKATYRLLSECRWWLLGMTLLGIAIGPDCFTYVRGITARGYEQEVLWNRFHVGAWFLVASGSIRFALRSGRFTLADIVEVALCVALLATILRVYLDA